MVLRLMARDRIEAEKLGKMILKAACDAKLTYCDRRVRRGTRAISIALYWPPPFNPLGHEQREKTVKRAFLRLIVWMVHSFLLWPSPATIRRSQRNAGQRP